MKKTLLSLMGVCLLTMAMAQKPKNVIYVVGDGMGTAQVYSALVANKEKSSFLRFPICGFSRTYSLNKYTTDSGAGGTALMTGHKVENYHIAYGPKGEWYPSILAMAHNSGKSTGFVVTVSSVDATPAATYAHVPNRNMKDTISMQMAQSTLDVMIGCDKARFETVNRKDGLAPLDTLQKRGYDVVFSIKDMKKSKNDHLCALLTANDEPGQPKTRGPILKEGVKKALEVMGRNKNGFVLMVEGSQIDWACHNNDYDYLMEEINEFDEVLGVILDYAQKDGNTLVVVTADHETGGLTLLNGNIDKAKTSEVKWTTGGHSGVMVPVFAFGPGAEQYGGIHQNVDIANITKSLLGIQ